MKRAISFQSLLIGIAVTNWAVAQPPAAAPETPREQVIKSFDRKAPQVGEPLPDVTLLDADGKEFRLASLRGKHTVLVFGCLT
jgi:cytochrome oxidase Cu insertion factor (SCO1/SenC/PrrC family)